jgi:Mg2+ and Co2+ transporter CorA
MSDTIPRTRRVGHREKNSKFLPLTLVASSFGMTARRRRSRSGAHTAYWVIVSAMIGVPIGMVGYFRKRGVL